MKLLGVQLHVPTLPIFDVLPHCAQSFTDKEKKNARRLRLMHKQDVLK
jgi:hypothetical protein